MNLKAFRNLIYVATPVLIISIVIYIHIILGVSKKDTNFQDYFKEEMGFIKGIIISFLGALLIAIIPNVLQENKYFFDMKTEAKKLYTQTKTGMLYLPFQLSTISDISLVIKQIEDLHQSKHLAEAYEKYLTPKDKSTGEVEDRVWGTDSDVRRTTFKALRNVLKENLEKWSSLSQKERFDLINKCLKQ